MTDYGVAKIQIGKNGLSENFFSTLETYFKLHKNVKVIVLKSARENREMTREYANKILEKLGKNYTARIVGHTIAVKKWRHEKKEEERMFPRKASSTKKVVKKKVVSKKKVVKKSVAKKK
jgi:RNA-binding protein YhbY